MGTPSIPVATRHVGLDLGGTNLKWALLERSGDTWTTLDRGQVPTDRGGPATIVPQMAAIAQAAATAGTAKPATDATAGAARTLGIGVPGLYDPATGITEFIPNVPGDWAGVEVASPVSAATGLPVALINDARAFGLAELRLGAGQGAHTMVGLTLGTGVGGVVCVGGQVLLGHKGTAGELGHTTVVADGPVCGCGNPGCLEMHARAERIAELCGTPTAEEAVRRAEAGDARAIAGLAEVGRWVGQALSIMVLALTPDRIVLGGGVAAAGELLLEPVRTEIRRRVMVTDLDRLRVVTAELGTWAGAIGAAVHGAEQASGRIDLRAALAAGARR